MNSKKIILKVKIACSLILMFAYLFSCQKDEAVGTVDIAKVNVINAVVVGGSVKVNVSNKRLPWNSIGDAQTLGGTNNLNRLFIVPAEIPTYLQIAPISDTTKLWYDELKQLNTGKMHTLYLSGTLGNVKALFHEEINFPKPIIRDAGRQTPVTDSIVNIRFVNLSPSGPKLDVNIRGNTANEATELNYQAFTTFKAYPVPRNVNSIVFEIRQSSDKKLLRVFSLPVSNVRFKAIAVIVMGLYPGTSFPPADQYRVVSVTY